MGAHSRHGTRYDTAGMRLIVALIAVCVIAVVGVTVAATVGGLTVTQPPVSAVSSTATVRTDPATSASARAFLAETYRAGVGPDVLDAQGAIIVATAVCHQNSREHVGLATLSQTVARIFPRLTRIQAATLVDDAIKYYCPV